MITLHASRRPSHPCWAITLVLLSTATGCSTTASISTWQPAEQQFPGVERLAVLKFHGPRLLAQQARSEMVAELRASRVFDVEEVPGSASVGPHDALRAGQRLGSDAVLVGWVTVDHGGTDIGGSTISFGDPTVTAKLRIKLIDVRTAQILAERTLKHSLKGDFQAGNNGQDSTGQVAARLVTQCTLEAVAVLAPYRKSINIPLAGAVWGAGASEIRAGNQLARQGRWEEAEENWLAAFDNNPDSDAAKYNLGVAHEAHQRFDIAREMYLAAQAQDDRPLYQEALMRLSRNRREYELAFGTRNQPGNPTLLVRHESRTLPRRSFDRTPIDPRHAEMRRLPPIETSRFH